MKPIRGDLDRLNDAQTTICVIAGEWNITPSQCDRLRSVHLLLAEIAEESRRAPYRRMRLVGP